MIKNNGQYSAYIPPSLGWELIMLRHWINVRDDPDNVLSFDFCYFVSAWSFCEASRTIGRHCKQFSSEKEFAEATINYPDKLIKELL